LLREALASRTVEVGGAGSGMAPPTPEEMAPKFPLFEITECLGRGGMGVVYKARQKSLDRWVAIKVLAPERVGEERFAERFAREAQLLARLNHPNIVTVYDYGQTDGLFFIVMEYVDGVNLRDLLRDGKVEARQALAIVPPVCDALQYAHDKGIVHRDIKPENLLIDRDGRVKIADFGIAALVGAGGEAAGTPPYMAPEQAGREAAVDHRADIYALGVVLYELLTGERPGGDLMTPLRRLQIDVRLDEIVLRALEKAPERRFQTAVEFRTRVETVAAPAVPTQKASVARRMAIGCGVLAVLGLLLVALPGVWFFFHVRAAEPTAVASQPVPAPGAAVFDPVTLERDVYRWEMMDLDTDTRALISEALHQGVHAGMALDTTGKSGGLSFWMFDRGMDVWAEDGYLTTFAMKVAEVRESDWQQMSAAQVEGVIASIDPRTKPVLKLAAGLLGPSTYAVQTREGGAGLLQVARVSGSPDVVRVRFKRVRAKRDVELSLGHRTAVTVPAFEFRWVAREGDVASTTDELADPGDRAGQGTLRVEKSAFLTGADVERATRLVGEAEQTALAVCFTEAGGRKLAAVSAESIGRRLAIVWNGRVVAAPVIQSPLGRDMTVTGNFTEAEAQQLLEVLNHRATVPGPP
jgi:tRNA A-37 threonylcarbamoyl transferase component Bud32